jgi:hypothetical protein
MMSVALGIRPLFADKQTYPTAASLLLACVERAAGFAFGGGMTFVLLRANDRHPSYLPALRRWGRSAEPLWPLAKAQTLQLRADVSYSVLTPFGRPDSIPKEREPVPDERYRNRDVIEDVKSGNWLDGDCNHPRCQRRTDPVAQGSEYALQRVVIGQHRDHHDEHDA